MSESELKEIIFRNNSTTLKTLSDMDVTDITDIITTLSDLTDKVTLQQQEIVEVEEKTDQNKQEIDSLGQTVFTNQANNNAKFINIDTTLASYDTKIVDIDNKVNSFDTRLTQTITDLTNLQVTVQELHDIVILNKELFDMLKDEYRAYVISNNAEINNIYRNINTNLARCVVIYDTVQYYFVSDNNPIRDVYFAPADIGQQIVRFGHEIKFNGSGDFYKIVGTGNIEQGLLPVGYIFFLVRGNIVQYNNCRIIAKE